MQVKVLRPNDASDHGGRADRHTKSLAELFLRPSLICKRHFDAVNISALSACRLRLVLHALYATCTDQLTSKKL